uniref:Transposase n=1 Tax=Globodera rostochiensis TaxID=31243 RepID=A0A914HR56_GLORO
MNPIQLISLDKLNPIQLIRLDRLNPIQLIRLDKLNPIQLIRMLLSQGLITLDKLNSIQLIRMLLSQSLITLYKFNPIQLIRILLAQRLIILRMPKIRKAELNCVGIKNSHQNEINEIVAKELGLCFKTIYAWKSELGQTKPNHKYSHSEQKELMKRYYAIKDKNPKIKEVGIAKSLNISRFTLLKWKKLFKGQQMHQNSVDGHSVEENAAANVQEIVNINSESS